MPRGFSIVSFGWNANSITPSEEFSATSSVPKSLAVAGGVSRSKTLIWYALPTDGNPDRTHIAQDGAALQPEQTCSGKPVSSGLEGLVCKHRDRAYRAGTSPDWVKVKNRKHPSIERVKEAFS